MVYILIPAKVYDSFTETDFAWFENDFCQKIKSLFSSLAINLIRKDDVPSFELYFMNKQVSSRYTDAQVINHIIKILKNKYGVKIGTNPIVRLNYSIFNPKFSPVSDKSIALNSTEYKNDEIKTSKNEEEDGNMSEFDYEKLSLNYQAREPKYSFNQVVLSPRVKEKIEEAIGVIEVENKVFDEWGLRAIIPYAASAMSFYGPPGTGKSMAAEAIAHKLGKKIMSATYADIESKYHGEGPKMVKAIFKAAEREGAVLFLDESDSLLSKRLTNVSNGSDQAINSMRSQLLISLEQFKGIVIFATNLVVNYDKAFVSRLINIEFTYPAYEEREKIWWNHLRSDGIRVPLGEDVNIQQLALEYEFSGREIKSSVKNACVSAALRNQDKVTQKDFIAACNRTILENEQLSKANDHTQIQ